KEALQIKKFLRYLKIEWADEIEIPKMKDYQPKRITIEDVKNLLSFIKNKDKFGRYKALILLGATSGMRAEEIYKLQKDDIHLNERKIVVRAEIAKTKKTRICFFSKETKEALENFLRKDIEKLFPQDVIHKDFRFAPLKVKDLRKFFSQEWDRRNGNYFAKRILMGHSLKKDIDASHYTYLDEDDLKAVYDKVMGDLKILFTNEEESQPAGEE
ncbi:MAG: site-specific integrase, partial [Candidatus Thermoplasmatota archaeon]